MIGNRHSSEEQNFRRFLRECRLKAGLRQADLAKQLGVPQSFVSKYESGERLVTFVETLLILRELKADVKEAAGHTFSIIHESQS